MDNQIPEEIKKQRVKQLLEISKKLEIKYMEKFIGRTLEFIPEIEKDGYLYGHTGNYLYIRTKGCSNLLQKSVKIKIDNIDYPYCNGIVVGGDK